MIAAYADGYRVLKDDAYRQAAEKAADFLLARLRTPDGRLLRTYRDGQAKLPAYLEDYAFLAHGLLRLHAATGDPTRLAQARALTDRMIADFADTKEGGFFFTAGDHESLLARPKDPFDGALPSGNSVAIRNLVALAAATGEGRYLDLAGQALDAFSATLAETPGALPLMLVALEEYLDARPAAAAAVAAAPADALPGGPDVVDATAAPAPGAASSRDGEFDVIVTLVVKDGWHLYANPAGVELLKPTTVTLAAGQPATLAAVRYPAATATLATPGSPEKASVYEGEIKLDRPRPARRPGPAWPPDAEPQGRLSGLQRPRLPRPRVPERASDVDHRPLTHPLEANMTWTTGPTTIIGPAPVFAAAAAKPRIKTTRMQRFALPHRGVSSLISGEALVSALLDFACASPRMSPCLRGWFGCGVDDAWLRYPITTEPC